MLFIFDMGGVVTTTFHMETIADTIGISYTEFKNHCTYNGRKLFHELTKGQITLEDFWSLFNENITKAGLKPVTKDLFRLKFNPVLNDKTIELINRLKENNRVVCGTNTIQSHWEIHLERGDYVFFHKTYPSQKMNCEKPDAEFFQTILEAENITPSEAFFTDDKMENIEAARNCGINAELFTTAEELFKKWEKYF